MSGGAEITILNDMAGADLAAALDRHVAMGLRTVDLKQPWPGAVLHELEVADAAVIATMLSDRGLSLHCLSTTLFDDVIQVGREEFNRRHLEPVTRVVRLAEILRPKLIRLIAAGSEERQNAVDAVAHVRTDHPWLFDSYREAVATISAAGFLAAIENESGPCILGSVAEVTAFFDELDLPRRVVFTWDAVNMWRSGTHPTVAVYEELKSLIGYFHVKGGRADPGKSELRWKSAVSDASWPVADITRRVVSDGVSPVICINPPKGKPPPDQTGFVQPVDLDVAFMRRLTEGG